MSDANTDAINANITSPNVVSADGVSVTNNQISEQIAGKKFIDANSLLSAISGGSVPNPFVGVKVRAPSARGGCDDSYWT